MIPNADLILTQMKSLEVQLTSLRIQIQNLVNQENKSTHTLSDLRGILAGQGQFSEAEIDEVLYKMPPDLEAELATMPKDKAP